MHVKLDPKAQKFIEEEIRSGHFPDADTVVNAALLALQTEQESSEFNREHKAYIQEKIDEAIASLDRGEGEPWNADRLKDRVQKGVK